MTQTSTAVHLLQQSLTTQQRAFSLINVRQLLPPFYRSLGFLLIFTGIFTNIAFTTHGYFRTI